MTALSHGNEHSALGGALGQLGIYGSALLLDLDATDHSTLLATIGGSPASNGSQVKQWLDKSGNGRHASVTGATGPTRNDGAIGGQTALLFGGTENTFTTGTIPLGGLTAVEILIVHATNNAFTGDLTEPVGGITSVAGVDVAISGASRLGYLNDNSGSGLYNYYSGASGLATNAAECDRVSWEIAQPAGANDVVTMYVNGSLITTTPAVGSPRLRHTGAFSSLALTIGTGTTNGTSHTKISRVLVIGRKSTAPEITASKALINATYGVGS